MNFYHTTAPLTNKDHDMAMEAHCNMVSTMLEYAFAGVNDVSCAAMEALDSGLYVIAKTSDHYATDIVAVVARTDIAALVFEHCGKGHMLLNPEGFISYATPGMGTITVPFN